MDSDHLAAVRGLGNGQGSSGNGAVLIQARYSETPKPVYPESARSEGREGQVILRVLVDDQWSIETCGDQPQLRQRSVGPSRR